GKAKSYKDIMDLVKSGFDWDAAWDESKIVVRTLSVQDDEISVKTDKTSYLANEPINVTATGGEGDVVELYKKSDKPGVVDPIYSYPVSGVKNNVRFKSGNTYNIVAFGSISSSRYVDAKLKAGNYVIAIYNSETGKYVTTDFTVTQNYVYNNTAPSIATDKTVYETGEPIVVTATGGSNAWVGLYKETDSYGSGAGKVVSIYWYWVNSSSNGNFSGKPAVLQAGFHDTGSSNPGTVLAPGKYNVYIFSDGGYNAVDKVAIEVVPRDVAALTSLEYKLDNDTDGFANGTVTVKKNIDDDTVTDCMLYWGDENGNKLAGYSKITRFKLDGETTTVTMPTHLIIPTGAKKLLAFAYDGSAISDKNISVDLPANSQYDLTKEGMTAEFQIVSDIHLTTDAEATNEVKYSNKHFQMLLEDVAVNSPDSLGIVINGDIANTGKQAEFQKGYNIYTSVKSKYNNLTDLHLSIGNHDWIKGNPNKQFQVFAKLFNKSLEKTPEKVYYDEVLGGYHFVYLGSEQIGLHATLSQEQLNWFDDLMAKCTQEDPDKPVFVFLHQSLYSTVAGSLPGQGWHGVNNEHLLKNILKKYNQILFFNGHSHWEYDSQSNMFAGDEEAPVAFNTSSVSYLWTSYNIIGGEHLDGSQAYYVRIYKDKVLLLGKDVETGEFCSSALYVVEQHKLDFDKSEYVVSDTDEIQMIKIDTEDNATVNFTPVNKNIVLISDEGAIIPKAIGETDVVVSIESSKTKVITRKNIKVKVVKGTAKWSNWVHDPATKTHSRKNLSTGAMDIKSCNSTSVSRVKPATLKKNGQITKTCSVCKALISTEVVYRPKVSLSKTSFAYNNKAKKPTVKVVTIKNKKIDASNYTVTYAKGRKAVGTYKVTIKFKGNYTGKKVLKFSVVPKPTKIAGLNAGSKSFTVKWKKGNKKWAKSYQIRYSTSKKFKGAKIVNVKGLNTVSKTVSNLKSGKKYYVQVRVVKNKCYSSWTKAKNVKVK
ncbi:MAG: metallophosphoesterase, partial [Clostridia bacterium]|nr:metallophosphoesterase [Clostridia bacterium]